MKLSEQIHYIGKSLWDARKISVDEADILVEAEAKLKPLEQMTPDDARIHAETTALVDAIFEWAESS